MSFPNLLASLGLGWSWVMQAKTHILRQLSVWLSPFSYRRLEATPNEAEDEPPNLLSGSDLARLLGNQQGPVEFVPRRRDDDDDDDNNDEAVREESDGEEEGRPSGEELLDALEAADSAAAAGLASRASKKVVNYTDGPRRSPLLLASMEGHVAACRVLLGREDFKHVNARNTIGSTALHMAAANGHQEVVELLLSTPRFSPIGGINTVNDNGQTALDFALEFGDGVAADLLVSAGGRQSGARPERGRRRRVIQEAPAPQRRRPGDDTIAEDSDAESTLTPELEEDEGRLNQLD